MICVRQIKLYCKSLVWLMASIGSIMVIYNSITPNPHQHKGPSAMLTPMDTHDHANMEPEKQKRALTTSMYRSSHRLHSMADSRNETIAWRAHTQPVTIDLRLPSSILDQPALASHAAMFRQYGFNLNLSNHIPLMHDWPDYRNDACKARKWSTPHVQLPKASVIIIFYNEPLSTLLRNVVGVLNRSPPELLGEIVLVDDHSQMNEHAYLHEHIARLQARLPPGKVRLVHRNVHNGIVGARVRGAEEAIFPIIVRSVTQHVIFDLECSDLDVSSGWIYRIFLDSHAEVCDGWLEPLLERIHGDRKRVVIPNIRGINIETMELIPGGTWPPSRGSFNWKLSFTIVLADAEQDVLETDVPKQASATTTPVMPGGLFAMDREFFFELGAYDPEIMYYGAEHVELSFRVWMCGGTMEVMPCSNVGHIYREFDRFGVDPQLKSINVGTYLARNDARVAEVWLDEYKQLFYNYRNINGIDLGDLTPRKTLRERLQCHSFDWFLKNVCRDIYVPEFNPNYRFLVSKVEDDASEAYVIDSKGGHVGAAAVTKGLFHPSAVLTLTPQGYLQFGNHNNHKLICLRTETMSQVACGSPHVAHWTFGNRDTGSAIASIERAGMCLERGFYSGDLLKIKACNHTNHHQTWVYRKTVGRTDLGSLSGNDFDMCIDNMQKTAGPPGLYGCHGYGTQRWTITTDGKIKAGDSSTCLGYDAEVNMFPCLPDDPDFQWSIQDAQVQSRSENGKCLERVIRSSGDDGLALAPCDSTRPLQRWELKSSKR